MKALVIGLDGITFDLLGPWIEQGHLPTLKRVMEGGAWGTLTTTTPPISSSAWSSFVTGKNPGKHGVVDFVFPKDGTYQVSTVNSTVRGSQAIWNILSAAGRRVGIMGMPLTYPPEAVNGFMISDFLTPSSAQDYTYPPALKQELETALGGFQLRPDERYRSSRQVDRFVADLAASVRGRTEAALYMMAKEAWDLFTVVFWSTDMIQHDTWHILDSSHPQHDPRQAARFKGDILGFWRTVDEAVAQLMAAAGDDTLTLIMSDHGFGPVHSFLLVNNWLRELGLLELKRGPLTRLKLLLFKLGFTPLRVFRLAKAVGLARLRKRVRFQQGAGWLNRLFISFADVDWSRTQAYSVGSFGQVYLNLAGKRPQGIVQPGAPYEALRERIIREAQALCDPRTGERLIDHAYRREELYTGPYMERLPDVILLSRGLEYMAFGHADFGSNRLVEPIDGLWGHHRPNGVVMMAGPAIEAGTHLEGAKIIDLAPTLLFALGLPVPVDMDGQVLKQAFETDFLSEHEVIPGPAVSQRGVAEQDYSEEEAREVEERLRALGYLG